MNVLSGNVELVWNMITGSCYEKVREKTEAMKAQLKGCEDFLYNQTSTDIKTLVRRLEAKNDPLSWWNENLKKRVKWETKNFVIKLFTAIELISSILYVFPLNKTENIIYCF